MASQTHGIQQLLQAEKRAAEKVSEARKRKARRLKQAKEEAQSEIERYRGNRERQFKEFESKHLGSREGIAASIDADTNAKIQGMRHHVAANKEQVINRLLEMVCDIRPEVHRNYRKNKV